MYNALIKILFVCHGNICRSPMAQYIFQKMVDQAGLQDFFEIDSAATSTEEIGNPVYPPAMRTLQSRGIKNITHRARQMSKSDYRHFDLIFVMDSYNLRNVSFMTDGDPDGKISLLLGDEIIDDPWYTGDFLGVYNQIERGCRNLLNIITNYVGMDKKTFPVYSALFSSWCRQTCAPRMQDRWTAANRTLGQCSVTAFLVQDILGGDVYATMLDDGNLHCFNVIDGKTYDLTSAQLEKPANYNNSTIQSRDIHFSKEEKYNRYLLLKKVIRNQMNIEERAEQAAQLKLSGKYNCAQSVVTALADQCNLSEEQLQNLSAGFCAGMGTLQATCGALVGAAMIAGLKTEGNNTLSYTRQMIKAFEKKCGAVTCKDLKAKQPDGSPLCPCEDCVRNAIRVYGEVFSTNI